MKKYIITTILFAAGICVIAQSTTQSSSQRGKKLYTQYCLTCHQEDGEGVPRMNPPLTQTSYVLGDKKKLIAWVLKGSTENIPIDDKTYSNNMPPQNYLKDQEIADILTYVRSSFGNKATSVTMNEVKTVRATIK
jgi:mono/diheme cytochrome c family protein